MTSITGFKLTVTYLLDNIPCHGSFRFSNQTESVQLNNKNNKDVGIMFVGYT